MSDAHPQPEPRRDDVLAELAMSTREGQSVRGGAFGDVAIASSGDVDAAIDAAVQAVAARHGVTVQMPSSGGGDGATSVASRTRGPSAAGAIGFCSSGCSGAGAGGSGSGSSASSGSSPAVSRTSAQCLQ